MVPEPIEDATLGRFTWDQEQELWLGTVEVTPGASAWLTINVGPSEGTAVLPLAREAAARARELEPEARRFLAAQLKARPSETSRVEPGDVEEAVGQMVLNSVGAGPDGVLELVYSDEGLFGGVGFFVWFDADGDRGIIVLDEGQTPGDEESA